MFRDTIFIQNILLSGTISEHSDDKESASPKDTVMSARTLTIQEVDPHSSNVNPPHAANKNILLLALGALGVVFGDIGTSPLYTVQTIFLNVPVTPDNIVGAISSIFWLLNLTVTLKYVVVIMRADNRGEGGIMALTALASQSTQTLTRPWWKTTTMMIGELYSRPYRLPPNDRIIHGFPSFARKLVRLRIVASDTAAALQECWARPSSTATP